MPSTRRHRNTEDREKEEEKKRTSLGRPLAWRRLDNSVGGKPVSGLSWICADVQSRFYWQAFGDRALCLPYDNTICGPCRATRVRPVILRDRWLRATTGVREHLASLTGPGLLQNRKVCPGQKRCSWQNRIIAETRRNAVHRSRDVACDERSGGVE